MLNEKEFLSSNPDELVNDIREMTVSEFCQYLDAHPMDPGLLLKQLSKKTGGMYVEFLNTIEGLPEDDLKLLLVMARRLTGTSDEM